MTSQVWGARERQAKRFHPRGPLARLSRAFRNRVRRSTERPRDRWLGIETIAPDWTDGWDGAARNVRYEAARYKTLDFIRRRLPLSKQDVVFDVGCGLGRVVCYFAQYPVARCVGVELDEELARGASRNVASARRRKADASIICCDATTADYDAATVLFMFNPFNAEVMELVLRKLAESVARRPRDVTVIYVNPIQIEVFRRLDGFRELASFHVPRIGVPDWSPVKLGGDKVSVWQVRIPAQ